MKNYFAIIIIVFAWTSSLFAQQMDEVKKMYSNYLKMDTIVTEMKIRIYPVANGGCTSRKVTLKKINNKYLYLIDGNLMLNTNEYSLFVNNDQHQLIVSSNKNKKSASSFNLDIIDTLLKKCDSVSKPLVNGSKVKYCLYSDKQQIYKTCLSIDTVNHFLTFVSYDYNEDSEDLKRVEIDLDNSVSVIGNLNELDITNYLTITNDHKYLPSKKYYYYEVITID